jgi:hypothetical protein
VLFAFGLQLPMLLFGSGNGEQADNSRYQTANIAHQVKEFYAALRGKDVDK